MSSEIDLIRAGNRRALAKAITLVESTRADHRAAAADLLRAAMPLTGGALRIGLSGAPGAGKSTFIEAFGLFLLERGHKVAVLAVDPSSSRSGGSILGDKTRMEQLSADPRAFIRPSPSGGTLGGVARRTREALLLVEAAGFDVVLVETVGVGQSEIAVADMVDLFALLVAPGGGDELQGIKRGIMELADMVIVTKADGDLLPAANRARAEYNAGLHLMRPKYTGWAARALPVSAITGTGLAEVWDEMGRFRTMLATTGAQASLRATQARAWMWNEINERLGQIFRAHPAVAAQIAGLEHAVAEGRLPPAEAAATLLAAFGAQD